MIKYILFLIIFSKLYASSCCGGGSSSSMIITGDNRAELSLGYSYRNDVGQTDTSGNAYFNNSAITDQKQTINLQAQYQVSEYTQLATKTSFVEKELNKSGLNESNMGLGDIDLQATYEYLPEFTYHPIKPRGFIYFKSTIPTSKSLYNSESSIKSDVRGTGLYSIGLGNFFIKKFDNWTIKFTSEWNHFFGRNYKDLALSDYDKLIIPIGVSHSFDNSDFTIGFTDSFSYQTSKTLSGMNNSTSASEYFWELNTFINYSLNRNQMFSLSYSDSTLIGKNINSPLYRSAALTYIYSLPL